MCFSANASLTAGLVVGGLGAATLPLVTDRRERAFAALPLIFGVHQIVEGIVWSQVEDAGAVAIRTPAVAVWLLIAWFLLPVFVPLAVARFEPDEQRRRAILVLAGVGAAIGLFLVVASVWTQATVQIKGSHLQYAIPFHPGWLLGFPYVAATCLPLLASSHRFVVRFGVALSVSMAATAAVNAVQFSSVWCFFAALLSVGLAVHYATEWTANRRAIGLATP